MLTKSRAVPNARRLYLANRFTNPSCAAATTGWTAGGGGTLARRTDDGNRTSNSGRLSWNEADGSASLLIGDAPATSGVACVAGDVVYARLSLRPLNDLVKIEVYLNFFTAANAFVNQIIVAQHDSPTTSASWWETEGWHTVAGGTVAYAQVGISVTSAVSVAKELGVTDVMVLVNPVEGAPFYTATNDLGRHAAPSESFYVGFNDNSVVEGELTQTEDADLLHEMGVNATRLGIRMDLIQPTEGAAYDWSATDTYVDLLASRNIRCLALCGVGTDWMGGALPNGSGNYEPPTAPFRDDYAALVAAFMERYDEHLIGLEVWNEPNLKFFWDPVDAADYVDLLETVSTAVRQVSDHPIIGGVLAGSAADSGTDVIGMANYLDDMLAADAGDFMDAISIHPYPGHRVGTGTDSGYPTAQWRRGIDLAMREARARVDTDIWVTEVGHDLDWSGMTEAKKAMGTALVYDFFERQSDVPGVFFHTLVDLTAGFNFVAETTHTRLPAYESLRRICRGV